MISFSELRSFNNRRVWAILFQGFSSGLPLALVAGTLQAWLTVSNIDIISIGLFSLVSQPYVYKFLWAPMLDRFIPPFLGRRRGWIFIFQLCLVASIAWMALTNPVSDTKLMAVAALLTALFSASQDISINAYMTDILLPDERGIGASMTVLGYRVALLVSGAFALIMVTHIGWRNMYLVMSGIMLVNGFITWFLPEPELIATPISLTAALLEPLKEFLQREAIVWILLFIVLYKLGEAFTLSLSTTFLLRDVHFSLITVGTVNKFGAMIAVILGAIVGGLLLPKLKLFKSLLFFGLLQTMAILLYMFLAIVGKNYLLMVIAVVAENFCGGMATSVFTAFLMSLCDHRYTATQFALLTAVMVLGRVFVGPLAGVMVKDLGWAQFYFWSFLSAIPGLLVLLYLRRLIRFDA